MITQSPPFLDHDDRWTFGTALLTHQIGPNRDVLARVLNHHFLEISHESPPEQERIAYGKWLIARRLEVMNSWIMALWFTRRPTLTLLLCDHQLPAIRHLLLTPGDHHLANLDRGAGDAAPKLQVTADHFNIGEHLFEIPGDGDFLHRIGQFAVLDPKSGGSSRIVARDHVDPKPDQLCDVQPLSHRSENLGRGSRARDQIEVRRSHRWALTDPPRGVAGRGQSQLSSGVGIQEIARQHPSLHYRGLSGRKSFSIKWTRSQATRQAAVVINRDELRSESLPELPDQE